MDSVDPLVVASMLICSRFDYLFGELISASLRLYLPIPNCMKIKTLLKKATLDCPTSACNLSHDELENAEPDEANPPNSQHIKSSKTPKDRN